MGIKKCKHKFANLKICNLKIQKKSFQKLFSTYTLHIYSPVHVVEFTLYPYDKICYA